MKERVYFVLNCSAAPGGTKQHVACKRLDSLRRKPGFDCPVCHTTGASNPLLREVVAELEGGLGALLGPIAFECHLLKSPPNGKRGGKAFDIYAVLHGLAIEVDSDYHFKSVGQGVWDRKVDEACMQEGLRLVRLHRSDRGRWAEAVFKALTCREVVTWSPSYKL